MRHFVQYHNTERMGYRCGEGETGRFEMLTDKPIRHLLDNTVWLIAGEGRRSPKRYFLCKRFIVDHVGEDPEGRFKYCASGEHGIRFRPLVPLDEYPWFHDLKASVQNFSLGVREIDGRYVAELETLARAHNRG